eukprot:COSAG01_NODE_5683_length_4102_cov_19.864352_2_plen_412_part_00
MSDFFNDLDLQKAKQVQEEFPVFKAHPNLCYLDNAATTHKPVSVIHSLRDFYAQSYATVHRGVYTLSQEATARCEAVRQQVADFIRAQSASEIVFVRGTTEGINLLAATCPAVFAKAGQDIVITAMEHHANIVPWQEACKRHALNLKVWPILSDGTLDLSLTDQYLTSNTALFACCHASNILGSINPIKYLIKQAHALDIKVMVDGAQGPSHFAVDVQDLDCDFYVFSGHKIYGPTGIGVLYGKANLLQQLPPYQTGGAMIDTVTFDQTSYADVPMRFEAGTPAIAEIIGLGEALSFVSNLGYDYIERYEIALMQYALEALSDMGDVTIYGESTTKIAVISFNLEGVHPHDAGTIFDTVGVAVRAGHHCAQPLMKFYDVAAMLRASFSIYNQVSDVDRFVKSIKQVFEVMT